MTPDVVLINCPRCGQEFDLMAGHWNLTLIHDKVGGRDDRYIQAALDMRHCTHRCHVEGVDDEQPGAEEGV